MICPSYPSAAATLELGAAGDDGRVHFHEQPVVLRPSTRRIGPDGPNERRRHAGPYQTSACTNWVGRCKLGDWLAALHDGAGSPCAIASSCRWFTENGPTVCEPCTRLVRWGPLESWAGS